MGAHSKYSGYGRYVGRLGALAIALGVGTAPGLAWAAPEAGEQTDTGISPPSVPTSPDPTGAVTPEPIHDSSSSPNEPTASPSTGTGTTTNSSQVTVSVGEGSSPPVTVSGSGSLNTTINGEQTSTAPTNPTEPTQTPTPLTPPVTPTQTNSGNHNPVETAKIVTVPNTPAPANQDSSTKRTIAPKVVGTPNTSAVVALKTVEAQSFTATPQPIEAIVATPAPEPAPAPVNVIAKVLSAVLAPLLLPSPESPAAPALLWGVLAWTRRESERTTTDASDTTYNALTTTGEPATPAPALRTASLAAVFVAPPNKPPTATPTITKVDGATGIVTGRLNAVDPNGDPLTYGIKTPPANGTVDLTATGNFTYTPTDPARHTASATPGADLDSFVVNVSDGRGGMTAVRVSSVPVTPKNAAPVSGNPTVGQPNPATGVVIGSVSPTDADGDGLTFTVPRSTTKGSVVVNANGTFTYTPTAAAQHNATAGGAAAIDSFTVTVNDGHGATLAVPVTVAVNPKNAAPVSGTVTVGNPNATTGVVSGTVRATDSDRDTLIYNGSTSTAKGAVVVNANGTFTYTPTAEARHQAAASAGATDSFIVTANDGHGGTVAMAVNLAVSPQNAAPKNGSAVVGQPDPTTGKVTGTVSATDTDGDILRYGGPTSTAKGAVAVSTDGTFTYTPTAAARHAATAGGAAASDSFTVTANDGHGGTLAIAVKVTVSPQNAVPKNDSTVVGQPNPSTGVVTGSVSATDTDADALTYTGPRSTPKASVVVNANGTFTYTPTATAQHDASLGGAAASDSFTVTVNDGHGATLAIPVTVAINPKNAAPIGGTLTVGNPNATTGVVTGTVRATDADRDALTYNGTTSTAKGKVVVNGNGTFSYTPTAAARHDALAGGAAATDSFTVTANDGHGGTVAVAVNVAVSPQNAAPKNGSAVVGQPNPATGVVFGSVSATDADGDALRFSGPTSTTKGNVAVNADGTFTYTPTDLARHKAVAGGTAAADSFTVTASDGHGGTLAVAVSVTVSPKNVAPANPTVTVGQPNPTTGVVTGTVKAIDPDGDTVRYSGTTTTGKGSVTVSTGGAFTYTPTAAAQHAAASGGAGATDTFTVTATDQYGAALPVTVTVTVNPKNKVPTNGVTTVGQPDAGSGVVTGTVRATDPDGDTLKYSGSTTTGKGSVAVDQNGSFTYTPTAEAQHAASQGGAAAKDTFAITADDGHGGTLAIQVSVNVNPKNAAPVVATAPSVGNPNSAGVVTGKLNVTDADGDALSYQVVTGPTRGTLTIDSATGTYVYTAKPEERLNASLTTNTVETDSFTIRVTDGRSAPIVVSVGNVLVAELPANTVTGTPGVGDGPRAVVLSADGTRAYVANTDDDTVTVINTTNNTTVRTIQVGDRPTALALNTGGSTLYVANAGGNSVTSINTATGAVITTVGIGHEPTGITVSPDGAFVYTANADNTITIVTVASGHAVSVGIDPSEIVMNHAGTRVYALNTTDGDVSIIDPSDGSVLDTIHVGDATFGMAINPDDTHLYVTQGGANNQVVIVKLDDKTFDYVHVGLDPRGIAVTPDGKRLYVANFGSDTVSVVDLTDDDSVTDINVGHGPLGVSIDGLGLRATVTNSLSDTVTVILIAGNEPPVLHDTRSTNFGSGVVSGSLGATDADGDTLSYSTTQGALGGVTIDGAGNYVYTPTPAARHAAAATPATDTFTLTVDDGHGSSVTKIVTVDIVPQNFAPSINPAVSSPADGVVVIDLRGTDPDGDALSYTVVSGPTSGTLTVEGPGRFTYRPSDAARSAAAASPGTDFDSFAVTVDDGHGAPSPAAVFVPVAPTRVVGDVATGSGFPANTGTLYNDTANRAVVITGGFGSSSVSVVNTSTGTRVGSGATVTGSVVGATLSADGTRLVVTSRVDSPTQTIQATVIDTATGAQVGTTVSVTGMVPNALGGDPFNNSVPAVLSAGGSRAVLVANAGFNSGAQVAVIDTATGTQIGSTVTLDGGVTARPQFNAAGDRVVVLTLQQTGPNQGTRIGVIDTNTGTALGSVSVAGNTWQTLTTPDRTRFAVYTQVFATQQAQVALVDTATGLQVGSTIVLSGFPANPTPMSLSSDGHLLGASAANNGTGTVVILNTATGVAVGAPVVVPGSVTDIKFAPATRRAVVTFNAADPVTGASASNVSVLDTGNAAQVGTTVALVGIAQASAFTADGTRATFASLSSNRTDVTTVDTVNGGLVGTSTFGGWVRTPKFNADGTRLALIDYDSGTNTTALHVVDATTGAAVGSPLALTGTFNLPEIVVGGNRVAITTSDFSTGLGQVGLVDFTTGTPIGTALSVSGRPIQVVFNADAKRALVLVSDSENGAPVTRIVTLNGDTGAQSGSTFTQAGYSQGITPFVVSADGTYAALFTNVNNGAQVTFFKTATGLPIGDTLSIDIPTNDPLRFDNDGTRATIFTSGFGTPRVIVVRLDGNNAPVISEIIQGPTDPADGRVTGSVTAGDPDGDSLTFGGSTTTATGATFVVNPDGTFTYTPTAAARHDAARTPGPDTETLAVTISDTNGASINTTITVEISEQNATPGIAPVVTSPADGIVQVNLHATDPDGDDLTYVVLSGPASGTLTALAPGQFRYTPSDAARSAAAASLFSDTDSFTVSVDDGHGTPIATTVMVQIAPTRVVGETSSPGTATQNYSDALNRVVLLINKPDGLKVQVVNTATGAQVGETITVAGSVASAAQLTPDSRRIVVTSSDFAANQVRVTVVNAETGALVSTVNLDGGFAGTQLTADSRRIVVTSSDSNSNQARATVINAETGAVVGSVTLAGTAPQVFTGSVGAQVAPLPTFFGASRAVLSARTSAGSSVTTVATIDLETAVQVGNSFSLSGDLFAPPTFNLYGDQVVIVTRPSGVDGQTQIAVLSTFSGSQVGSTIAVDGTPSILTLSSDRETAALVTSKSTGPGQTALQMTLLSTRTGQSGGSVVLAGVASGPSTVAFTSDGRQAILVGKSLNSPDTIKVGIADAATGAAVGNVITLVARTADVRVDGARSRVFVNLTNFDFASGTSYGIAVLDTENGVQAGSTITLAGRPITPLTTNWDRSLATVVVQTSGGSQVVTIATGTGLVTQTVTLGTPQGDPIFTADRGILYVITYDPMNNVTRLHTIDRSTGGLVGERFTPTLQGLVTSFVQSSNGGAAAIAAYNSMTNSTTVVLTSSGVARGPAITLTGQIGQTVFSADGPRVVSTSYDAATNTGHVIVYGINAAEKLFEAAEAGRPTIQINGDGTRIVAAWSNGTTTRTMVLDGTTGSRFATVSQSGQVQSPSAVQLSPDGKFVSVTTAGNGAFSVTMLRLSDGVQVGDTLNFLGTPAGQLRFDSDGTRALLTYDAFETHVVSIRLDG